jgi:hypothetical protein
MPMELATTNLGEHKVRPCRSANLMAVTTPAAWIFAPILCSADILSGRIIIRPPFARF